jgi:hypothetical protein
MSLQYDEKCKSREKFINVWKDWNKCAVTSVDDARSGLRFVKINQSTRDNQNTESGKNTLAI